MRLFELALLCLVVFVAASGARGQVHTFGFDSGLTPLGGQFSEPLVLPGVSPYKVLQDPSPLEAIRPPGVPQGLDNRSIYNLRPQSPYPVLRDPSPLPALNQSRTRARGGAAEFQFRPPLVNQGTVILVDEAHSPESQLVECWRRLLQRFERFNTRDNWKRNFAIPPSLQSGQIIPSDLKKTLRIMDYVDSHKEYEMVSKLPEFRELKRLLIEAAVDKPDK